MIMGGGGMGTEMAQAWASLGTHVTLVEGARHLLPQEEVFACELVSDALIAIGVDLRMGRRPVEIRGRAGDAGAITVVLDDGSEVRCDRVVAALGRNPNTDAIGLETVGIEGGGLLEIDEHCHVCGAEPWLYAIGDVNGHAVLTHMGKYQGRMAADAILGKDARLDPVADGAPPPRVYFSDPQVAAVGYTLRDAEAKGLNVRAVDVPTGGQRRWVLLRPQRTRHHPVRRRRGPPRARGVTFTGAEVTDFLHAATIAVVAEVPLERLRHAVPSFPTRSELWLQFLEAYGL